jgi:hypothetical protein
MKAQHVYDLRQGIYVDGVLMATFQNQNCELTKTNWPTIAEFVYLNIDNCASLSVADGFDISPTYCQGNQLSIDIFATSNGSCEGPSVFSDFTFAYDNCDGETGGYDTVMGVAFGYTAFTCANDV